VGYSTLWQSYKKINTKSSNGNEININFSLKENIAKSRTVTFIEV
jgi:hypothetical protein